MAASDHLYSNSLVRTPRTEEIFQQEVHIMELQPLIQVHKFGYPLRLEFSKFIECFKSLETKSVIEPSMSEREQCLEILQSISSLTSADYIVSDSKVFLKHDKERVMVSALWEKNGRSKRSYSRSRAQTCGELFPRGIGTSDLLEKYTKTLKKTPKKSGEHQAMEPLQLPSLSDEIFEDEQLRSNSVHFQSSSVSFNDEDVEIVVENNEGNNVAPENHLGDLEGKGRALLVMMSSLGQYDRMIPIMNCMRILFSSPVSIDLALHDSHLLQLTQAIESFQLSAHQNEDTTL